MPHESNSPKKEANYGVGHMTYLDDLAHVRKRAELYIGDLSFSGLHHLIHEVIANSIDEVMVGEATTIVVTVHKDDSITIDDDGRGIPCEYDESIGKSALEGAMTVLKYSAKFDNEAYDFAGGLHGMGLKAVNFLSQWCRVDVRRDGRCYRQSYERGEPSTDLADVGAADDSGTTIRFLPDSEMFGDQKFDYQHLRRRLQDAAFLNQGLKIEFRDKRRSEDWEVFQYERGIVEFIEQRNQNRDVVHPEVIHIEDSAQSTYLSVALQYCRAETEDISCFANNIYTQEGERI